MGELLVRRTWFGEFDELYFNSELSVGQTSRLLNMVWTVQRIILCFLTDLLMGCKLRPELRCAGCTQTHVHMLTHNTCGISSICGGKPWQLDTTAVPRVHLFISLHLLGPTDNADPPTSPQIRPFPPKRGAENMHAVSCVLLSQFFPLPEESSQVSTNQTQGLLSSTNISQSMSSEAFWTLNTASSQFELGLRSKSSPN